MRQVLLSCFFACAAIAAAQTGAPDGGGKIRVCVAPLENRATRSVLAEAQVNRLVSDLNQAKPGKHDRDRRPIEAIALESTEGSEARGQNCEFIVRTTLIELREPGDPQTRIPGTISIGPDPMSREPGPGVRNDIARRATVDFEVVRLGGGTLVSCSATDQESMAEDALVMLLMDRVASRANSVVRQ